MIVLRLGDKHFEKDYSQEVIDIIKRQKGSCDDVWFSTLYGYPDKEKHREAADRVKEVSKLYRDAGIGVSFQISNTIGHGEYMKSRDNGGIEKYGLEKLVGHDGTVADYCFCWRGKNFREYLVETTAFYAECQPDTVWLDDDFRGDNHSPVEYGCFCDNCIAEFNKRYNSNFTRESLVNEMNYGDIIWRARYIDFLREGLAELAELITKAVKEISPNSGMALEYAHHCNYMGLDEKHTLDALKEASGIVPKTRPGGGCYSDKEPKRIFEKTMRLNSTNSVLPDYVVDKWAEIENLPDVTLGKSIGGTIMESTLHLAYGCNGLTYATMMTAHEDLSYHEKMLSEFSRMRPYWDKLGSVSENSVRGGVTIVHGEAPNMRKMSEDEGDFAWREIVHEIDITPMLMGMPISHDRYEAPAYLLRYDMIDYLTDIDIEKLLTKPVLTDAATIDKLTNRGFGKHFPFSVKPVPAGAYREVFSSHNVNKGYEDTFFIESSFFNSNMPRYTIENYGDDVEVLGYLHLNISKERVGTTNIITDVYDNNGKKISKWAVFGYCVWNDVISSAKRNQILSAVDAISGGLPARLISSEQVAVIPAVDKDNKTIAVTLASCSPGGTDDKLTLSVRNPYSNKISVESIRKGEFSQVTVTEDGDNLIISLPELLPYEIVTIFFD